METPENSPEEPVASAALRSNVICVGATLRDGRVSLESQDRPAPRAEPPPPKKRRGGGSFLDVNNSKVVLQEGDAS